VKDHRRHNIAVAEEYKTLKTMKTSIFPVLSLLGVLMVEIDADHRSLLRGSTSTSSTSADIVAFGRGLQDSTNPFQFLSGTVPTTTITATTTNPFAYQGFGSIDNFQNCPVSATSTFCSYVGKAPVVCAGGCEYDNACLAAGTDLSDCVSSAAIDPDNQKELIDSSEPESGTCPVTGLAVSCLDEADPVVCGIDDCAYNNLCLAFGAGFEEDDCLSSKCPKPVAESCTKELVPVTCDDCIYDNMCIAGTAGFLENDCEPVDQEVGVACITARLPCEGGIGPVICDHSCEYSFLCIAIASGYSEDQCVPVEGTLIPVDTSGTFECPERDPDLVCSAIFAPVVCGDCVYENECVAFSAGYAADDCEPQEEPADPNAIPIDPSEPCPETGLVFCNKMYDPVICKDVCTYGNLCLGVGAGFLESDCLFDAR
jgi:hypothetical protein